VQQTDDALRDDEEQHHYRVLLEVAKTARRGETIALVFAMQGLGAVFGSVILLMLIYVADQSSIDCSDLASNSTGNDPKALGAIWRAFYLIGLLFVIMLLLYRWLILEEDVQHNQVKERQRRRAQRLPKASLSRWRLFRFYAFRLIGTGGNWFVWDIAFYGLKLYSGPIFAAINPEGSLAVQNGWLLFNNLCALAGYYCTAYLIDIPTVGRKRLQMVSFAICASLFFTTAAIFDTGSTKVLMVLYFASSFFGQVGANVTTYVIAAETYPGELRATFHGISAFLGKTGALCATVLFASMGAADIFYLCGATSVIGLCLTFLFTVDLTHVSLAEHDAQLELFLEGRLELYRGKLNDPKHLSNFEKLIGRHGEYDPTWASKIFGKEQGSKPPSPQASVRRHGRRRSLSSKSGVSVFVAVPEDGETEHRRGQWPPWQSNYMVPPETSVVEAEDGKTQ
jgi:Major Facilitator Superfamily